MDTVKLLKEESKKFQEGWKKVSNKRIAWKAFEVKASAIFNSVCLEARNQNLFENLYVESSKKHANSDYNPSPFVTLFWGNHPTGQTDFREQSKGKLIIEGGCALHYCQLPSGDVGVVYYPFKSELSEPNKKYYVYKLFSCPSKISEKDLCKHIKLMFSYAQYSSFMGIITIIDWYRMKRLQIRSKLRELWHSDWVEFLFRRIQRIVDNHIDELTKSNNDSSNKAN